MPGMHVTCFCVCLGIEIKGSVLEFSEKAIFRIVTGNFLVRMLLLLSAGEKAKQEQNKTHGKLLLKES